MHVLETVVYFDGSREARSTHSNLMIDLTDMAHYMAYTHFAKSILFKN